MRQNQLIKITDAARYLKISPSLLRKESKNLSIPHSITSGRHLRFSKFQLDTYILTNIDRYGITKYPLLVRVGLNKLLNALDGVKITIFKRRF